jgi:hypothetical protein
VLHSTLDLDGERVAGDVAVEVIEEKDEPSHVRLIMRELPRKRLLLILAIVLVNLCAVTYQRGRAIARKRSYWLKVASRAVSVEPKPGWKPSPPTGEEEAAFVGPWNWSRDDWAETVWPWR